MEKPDVVILNVMMPDVDGVEVSRRLRANPATVHMAILSISAHTGQKGAPKEMHSDEHLAKPFSLDQLYEAVARRMRERSTR